MKKIILTATAFTAACLGLAAGTVWDNLNGGLPIANFAISTQAPQDGSLFGHVVCNSGKLGDWLDDCGTVGISSPTNTSIHSTEKTRDSTSRAGMLTCTV